jgi:hypothetical protein
MRLIPVAIASLALVSTAAIASTTAAAPSTQRAAEATPACTTVVQKIDGSTGYKVVKQCLSAAREPLDDVMSAGGSSFLIPGVLGLAAVAAAVVVAADDGNDFELPDDSDDGLDPTSP